MNGKKNQIQYGLIKIIKKTNSSILFLANKNFMSFKNLILQIDLTKISEKERKEIENEIHINSLFNSRFILKIEDSNQDNDQLNIIKEYFEGKQLKDFLANEKKKDRKFIKEDIIWKIFIQLSLAIYRIHSKNVIHSNINLSNILIDSKFNLKLTYFNNSYLMKSEKDLCLNDIKPNIYMAPEIWKKEGYNTKSDIWSLGVVLYELCSFNNPFDDKNEEIIFQKVIYAKYPSLGNKYSKELIRLIDEMLRIKPEERISIKDIIHKYVFISKSKETDLFDYVDKVINPNKERILSAKNKFIKRPESGIKGRFVKQNVNMNRNNIKNNDKNKENIKINKDKKNLNNDIDKLTKQFLEVKKNIYDLIGKDKSGNLFEELSEQNIQNIIIKYTKEDINSEKSQKLEKLLKEYIQIMTKVCLIKNKIQ